jgi:hypothetical protein
MDITVRIAILFAVAMLVLYCIFNYLDLQAVYMSDVLNNSAVGLEGFTGSASDVPKLAQDIETLVNKVEDSLQVVKYRKDYEKLIIKCDELFELIKLDTLAELQNINSDDDKKVAETAERIQSLEDARKSLESSLNYIDTK